ncbi:MAG: T9SS type A sorting domain-containing protein, partial [Balneolaceae bacterium]|nr:T9SS type A sorting domain-containing protein [Balneolaceae bacterium]
NLWSFTTAAQPVGKLTALAPSDGATNVATSPTLHWGRDANATSYEVHVSATNFATLLDEATVTDTSYAPTGLSTQTSYQWRVRGRNIDGIGPWSDTLSFTTVPPSVSTPSMLSPAQNAQDVPIPTDFAWEADANATAYEIELFTDALLTTVFSFDVTDTTYTYDEMEAQRDYLFRVRAKNAGGTSNWANVEFRTGEKEVGTSTEWVSDADAIPTTHGLEQNYPNPFNPTTVIRYALPQAGKVQLEVYDMMGRKVSTLVRGTKPAGYHEAVFDASHLGSGAYMYRLMAGDVVLARTLYLIK